jgi:hypothetical protein
LILVQRGGSTTASDTVTGVTGPITGAASVSALEYPLLVSGNYLFAWTATATGSSGAITVDFAAGSNANPTIVEVVQLSGNNTGSPVVQQNTSAAPLGTANAVLSSPSASDGEIVLASYMANASLTTPSGFTALDTISTGSNGGESYGVYFTASAQGSASISSSASGLGWGTVAIELAHG